VGGGVERGPAQRGGLGSAARHGSTTPTAARRPRITGQYWGSISAP
jgi:hypothetical protein